jgi:hypothetical protein
MNQDLVRLESLGKLNKIYSLYRVLNPRPYGECFCFFFTLIFKTADKRRSLGLHSYLAD